MITYTASVTTLMDHSDVLAKLVLQAMARLVMVREKRSIESQHHHFKVARVLKKAITLRQAHLKTLLVLGLEVSTPTFLDLKFYRCHPFLSRKFGTDWNFVNCASYLLKHLINQTRLRLSMH